MDQPTLADLEYQSQKRKTRRKRFLERLDTAKRPTGKPAKDMERLTLSFGLPNIPTAKGQSET